MPVHAPAALKGVFQVLIGIQYILWTGHKLASKQPSLEFQCIPVALDLLFSILVSVLTTQQIPPLDVANLL